MRNHLTNENTSLCYNSNVFLQHFWPKIGREDRGLDKLNRIPLHVQKENSNVTEFTNLLQSHLPFDEL